MGKLLGAVLLITCGGWAGMRAAGELSARARALESWQAALGLWRGELAFRLPDLPQLLTLLSAQAPPPAAQVFAAVEKDLEKLGETPFEELWDAALAAFPGGLAGEDTAALSRLGKVLGRWGWEDQGRALDETKTVLGERAGQVRRELREKGRSYTVVGCALGCFLTILLI